MLKKILDESLLEVLNKIGFNQINEVRLRAGLPISVVFNGRIYFVGKNGLTLHSGEAIMCSMQTIENVIYKASEFSIYSVNEELKKGYIVLDTGERLGIAGSVIMENGVIKTITNFTSINIRVPHEKKGCCLKFFDKIFSNNSILNTLIISPPGQGKTTMLRDIAYQLSRQNVFYNLLILDERGEIVGKNNAIDVGYFCDVLAFCNKKTGFLQGIRTLNPNIILTDELGELEDFEAIRFAKNSGVAVIATIHASTIEELVDKPSFNIIKNVFSRYVLLKKNGVPGEVEAVFNQNFEKI